jgi:hypothetical protein
VSRRLLPIGAVCCGLVIIAAVAVMVVRLTASDTQTISGEVAIIKSRGLVNLTFVSDGKRCDGTNGFADLTVGAPVTVMNAAGNTIATGVLGLGHPVHDAFACVFRFTVNGVPKQSVYGIEVSHRGVLRYTQAQVAAHDVRAFIGNRRLPRGAGPSISGAVVP